MRLSSAFYILWCVMIVAVFAMATRTGYSPFASGGRPVFAGYGFGGPHHK